MLNRAIEQRPAVTRTVTFPAPTAGWVQSGNITNAQPIQAEVLDNFIPTAQGARLRGGIKKLVDAGASVERLFVYRSGTVEELFIATNSGIINSVAQTGGYSAGFSSGYQKDASVTSERSGTSGDYSTTQISTSGGQFLVGVNGADNGFTYNGTTFSDISLTGVASADLSQTWLFKRRLFFVEEGTTSAWYLPVDSIGGTVTEIDLGANFQLGGNLLFGATWSLDSGSGLDDVCLFVSDQGEVAVYEGTDPDSASTWSLVGVYRIGQPLNKHAFFQAGGDLAILTDDGIVPISEALKKDRAALQAVAITFPIEDAWKEAIANRVTSFPITATLWQSGTLLLVGTPAKVGGKPATFIANARTGAWARVTGWDVRCSVVFGDDLYFGTSTGEVYQADTGSTDDGIEYVGEYVPKFQDSDRRQSAVAANITYRSNVEANINLYAHSDYQVDDMQAPAATISTSEGAWGSGVWGTFVWGAGSELDAYNEWQFVRTVGYSMTPGVTIAVNQVNALEFEILATRLRIEGGYAL